MGNNCAMNTDLLSALVAYAFVSSITPGPNNLMMMASGVNFGYRRSLPHLLGIGIGFTLMIVLVGVGLMALFDLYPVSYQIMKAASIVYLLWLAWKIANAAAPGTGKAGGTPMTFLQAAAFQWVNPKAWTMALTAISVYAPARDFGSVLMVALIFCAVNLPSVSTWLFLGRNIRGLLTNPKRLRTFNLTMALLLVATLFPVIFG